MDRTEEKIRFERLSTHHDFKTFKEGIWESPTGKRVEAVATYEAVAINITLLRPVQAMSIANPNDVATIGLETGTYSIHPKLWNVFFENWKFIERYKGAY